MTFPPKTYSSIIRDKRISHGAFRLWHYLRDKSGDKNHCYPSLKTVCSEIGCGKAALLAWIDQLIDARYLMVQVGSEERRSLHYYLQGSIQNPQKDSKVLPRTHDGSTSRHFDGSKRSHELNTVECNSKNGGARLSASERIHLEGERKELLTELKRTMCDCPTDEEKARRRWVRDRISKIDQVTHIEL